LSETETITIERDVKTGQFVPPPPQTYGRESIEQQAGFEQMGEDPRITPEPEEKTFKSDNDGLREAAAELTARRAEQAQAEPDRKYRHVMRDAEGNLSFGDEIGWDPEKAKITGEKLKTLSLDRAVRDLTQARELEQAGPDVENQIDFANEVDRIRAEARGEQIVPTVESQVRPEAQASVEQQEATTQEAQPAADEFAEVRQQIERSPKLKAALEQTVQQVGQMSANYAQQLQQNAQALAQSQQLAMASTLAAFEEARSVRTVEELNAVINTLRTNNPQRAVQLQAHIEAVDGLTQAAQQAQAQAHHAYTAQVKRQVDEWDNHFVNTLVKQHGQAGFEQVQKNTLAALREGYGLSDQQIANLWGNPAVHEPVIQQMIADLGALHAARKAASQPAKKPIPPVQKPGTASLRPSYIDSEISGLNQRLNETGSVKDAARLLTARRRAASR
jgi:hypothetical protein